MKIDWLESIEQDGYITKVAKQRIYDSCLVLVKSAEQVAVNPQVKANIDYQTRAAMKAQKAQMKSQMKMQSSAQMKNMMNPKMLALQTAPMLALGLTSMGIQAIVNIFAQKKMKETINNNRLAIGNDPEIAHPEKAMARFDELARIAPSVAADPHLSKRLIINKIHEGFSDNDIQNLAMIQATHMSKTGAVMCSQEKLGSITADMYMLSRDDMDKTAARRKIKGSNIKAYLGTIGAVSAIPYFLSLGAGTVKQISAKMEANRLKKDLDVSFGEALKLSKEEEGLRANKEKSRMAFEALAHFAPHVALQPQAARAFMAKMTSYDQGLLTSDLKDLTDIERNMAQIRKESPPAFSHGFETASKNIGLPGITQAAFGQASLPFVDSAREL